MSATLICGPMRSGKTSSACLRLLDTGAVADHLFITYQKSPPELKIRGDVRCSVRRLSDAVASMQSREIVVVDECHLYEDWGEALPLLPAGPRYIFIGLLLDYKGEGYGYIAHLLTWFPQLVIERRQTLCECCGTAPAVRNPRVVSHSGEAVVLDKAVYQSVCLKCEGALCSPSGRGEVHSEGCRALR